MATTMATTNSTMTATMSMQSSNNCSSAHTSSKRSSESSRASHTSVSASVELAAVLRHALELSVMPTQLPRGSLCSAPEMSMSDAATTKSNATATARKELAATIGAAAPQSLSLDRIRELVFRGGCCTESESESLRPLAWRLLLGCLDTQPTRWSEQLAVQRQQYQQWKREFLGCRRQSVVVTPSPVVGNDAAASRSDSSAFEIDAALMKEIDKDVSRTQSALPFFAVGGIAQQWMRSILFVFAKRTPALGYMQGMNEILAPLVFVFATDTHTHWAVHAEADAFTSFTAIMQSAALLYVASPTDPTKSGVETQMARLTQLLRQHDAPLWQHLNSIGLSPDLYSFRWYMTLLAREFAMPTTLRIWDALLADARRFSFVHYVSCALIRLQRTQLLRHGFSRCLHLLQTLSPSIDIDSVLALAEAMRAHDRHVDKSRSQSVES